LVVDPSGAAVADATITATREATGAARTVRTDAAGRYVIASLSIGTYTIRCQKEGFQAAQVPEVYLGLNQNVDKTIQLKVATATNSIDVNEHPEAIDTTTPTAGTGISGDVLEETPSQNRSYLGVVLLAPGVAPAAGSNAMRTKAGIRSATPDSGFSVGGMRARNNGVAIDGLDNRDETTGSSRVAVGQEAVAEFRISASSVAPEFGGGAGGNLNVVTLSGVNRYHGDANLFASDAFIEARDPEAETRIRPDRRQWQPEAALNGPLRRDRTFFAGTVEAERESSNEFSEIAGAGLQSTLNEALASPAFSRAAISRVSEGYFPTESNSIETSWKLTHRLNAANEMMGRYAFSRASITAEVLGSNNFSEESARGSSRNQDQSWAAGWQFIPSASIVNELRFQFARRSVTLTPNSHGALLEIPGIVSIGQSAMLDASRQEDHFQVVEAATKLRGSHQLGFGASIQRITLDARLADRFGGVFVFPTLADFSRGTPDVFVQRFGNPQTRYSTLPVALWAQDQWRPANGVTVVYGVRYEAQRLPAPFGSVTRNVAPRLGIAWQPGGRGRWVFRGGAGLFYDRYPLAFLNPAIQVNGVEAVEQYAVGADAARAFAVARGGSLSAPLSGVAVSTYRPDPEFDRTPTYARKFTAGVERSIDADTTLSIEYMNVAGFHLPRLRNAALTLPPQYALEMSAGARYQGVSVSLHRRLSKELSYLISYTAGNARDDAGDFDEQPMNPANTRLDWSRSRQYQAHRIVASGIFELPFDEVPVKWLQAIGRHFDVAPVVSAGSPRPINALATTDLYRTGAFPISARPDDFSRNPFYERGVFSVDLRVTKGFVWWQEHGIVLFGVGVYNLTNHTNALRVSEFYGLPTYRGLIETQNARQVQFSWQWEF
jgi:hypothetical protein